MRFERTLTRKARMKSDLTKEVTFPISQPKRFGCNRSARTVGRWAKEGSRSRFTQELVTLEVIYVGAVPETSREAYHRFLRKLNGMKP